MALKTPYFNVRSKLLPLNHGHSSDEKIVVIGVDGDSHVIDSLETNAGDRSKVIIDIPRITRWALNANLTGVLIAHNHPTTDVTPSPDDLQEIQQLSKALKLFNISLVGSAIVNNEHVSWNKNN